MYKLPCSHKINKKYKENHCPDCRESILKTHKVIHHSQQLGKKIRSARRFSGELRLSKINIVFNEGRD